MSNKIEKVYLANHSHTDLGFTDHQDVVFRQHVEFIDRAIELCEYTANYPEESQYRWVCEVTGITERWFAQAILSDLEEAGYVSITRIGRRNSYKINNGLKFRHPSEASRPISSLLKIFT